MRTVNQAKHNQKRRDILSAAMRCFNKGGIHGTPVSKICSEAKISAGHLYHYFKSKEEIVGAIADEVLEHASQHLLASVSEGDFVKSINNFIEELTGFKDKVKHSLVFDFFSEAGRNPALSEILQKHNQSMRQLLVKVLEQGQQNGQINPSLDTEAAATIIISLIDGIKLMPVRNATLKWNEILEMHHTMVENFLSTSP